MVETVAFQGEPGAYSEQALRERFGPKAQALPCPHMEGVFRAVEEGAAQRGLVPVENSSAGTIDETYDLLDRHRLPIVGEHYLKVRHCLLGVEGSSRTTVKKVFSHPQALDQCRAFLEKLSVEWGPFYDTAGAARWVAEQRDPAYAAIASALAAEHYGLAVLAEGIQTYSHNTTRFLILAKAPLTPRGPCKTSIVFETRNVPAALYKCLGGFATNGVNLTKLESRPSQTGIGHYRFYLDCEGHLDEPPVDQALRELRFFTVSCRVLGSYPKADVPA